MKDSMKSGMRVTVALTALWLSACGGGGDSTAAATTTGPGTTAASGPGSGATQAQALTWTEAAGLPTDQDHWSQRTHRAA